MLLALRAACTDWSCMYVHVRVVSSGHMWVFFLYEKFQDQLATQKSSHMQARQAVGTGTEEVYLAPSQI